MESLNSKPVKVQLLQGELAVKDTFFDGQLHQGFVQDGKRYDVVEVTIDEFPAYYMVRDAVQPHLLVDNAPKEALATDEGFAYTCDLDHAFECLLAEKQGVEA